MYNRISIFLVTITLVPSFSRLECLFSNHEGSSAIIELTRKNEKLAVCCKMLQKTIWIFEFLKNARLAEGFIKMFL